jgi:hypothetical protein
MPSLLHSTALKSKSPSRLDKNFYVTNIGPGIAINVSIKNIYFPNEKQTYFCFNPIDMIAPGEEVLVSFEYYLDGKKEDQNFHLWQLQRGNSSYVAEIIFEFHDIEGNKYKQINRIGQDEYHHGFVKLL